MNYEVGNIIFVKQDTSASVVEGLEEAKITYVGRDDGDRVMCYIEWVERPMRHQKNGSFRPYSQVWVPKSLQQFKAA